jgi:hypothetical protein
MRSYIIGNDGITLCRHRATATPVPSAAEQ